MDDEVKKTNEMRPDVMMMAAVYAGPDQMPADPRMLMAYAGPQQMMMVYAGPAAGPVGIGMMSMLQQQQKKKEAEKEDGLYCFCPQCGYRCGDYRFCPDCGTPLKDVERYRDCPDCGTKVLSKHRFCPECGRQLADKAGIEKKEEPC